MSSPSPSIQAPQNEYQKRINRLIKDFQENPKKLQALLDDLEYQVLSQAIGDTKKKQIKTKIDKAKQKSPRRKLQDYKLLEWYVKLKPEKQTRGYMSQKDRRQLIGGIREPKELSKEDLDKIKLLLKERSTRSPTFYVEGNEIKRHRPVRISMDCPQQRRTFLLEAFDKILQKTQEE